MIEWTRRLRPLGAAALVVAIGSITWLGLVETTSAHTTLVDPSAPADSYHRARFLVAHGCDSSPTHTIRILIPNDVEFVSVWHKPGWTANALTGQELNKDGQGRRVTEVVWTGSKIPANEYDYFEIQVRLPDAEGRVLYFKTIQICDEGDLRWIEIPDEGRNPEDYESPAPSLKLTGRLNKNN